jgi:diguanylate cyclase (GGDEF)-like protein
MSVLGDFPSRYGPRIQFGPGAADGERVTISVGKAVREGPGLRMSRPHPTTTPAQRGWALCALLVPVCVLLWLPVVHEAGTPGTDLVPWSMIALLMLGASLLFTDVRFRQHTLSLSPIGESVLVGVAFLQPTHVLFAFLVARAATAIVQRQALLKGTFNACQSITGAGAAFWTYRLVGSSAPPVSLRGWGAVAAGSLVFDVVTMSLIVTVMALSGGRLQRSHLTGALIAVGLVAPANAVFCVLAVCAISYSAWGLALTALVAVGVVLIFRIQHQLREKHENLELLYRFSHSLAGLTEAGEVLGAVLSGAKELLSCREVELVIIRQGTAVRSSHHLNGALVHEDPTRISDLEQQVLDRGASVLVSRRQRDPDLARSLRDRGWRDAMVTPVGGGATEGLLIVGDRLGETSTFTPSDLRLLETLAAHSSVALRGSELLDRLRDEVEARSHEALHDSLTGLGNRAHFSHRLEATLEERGDRMVGVVMIDLDNFKEINDTLGHHTGDAVLQEAATRLIEALGSEGTASRIGGDEFAVVLGAMDSLEEVVMVARRIMEVISAPVTTGSITIGLQSSLGIAVAPDDGVDASTLLRRADVAMYVAKGAGTGIGLYDPATDPNTTRRLRLTSDLRSAVADDTLELWYQPKADLANGRITGVEALCRWSHPIYGNVPPDEFIPLAEQSGTIGALTTWVMARALKQLGQWDRLLRNSIDVAVNVSARNLMDVELVGRLERMIAAAEISPTRLTLELTESSIMSDPDRAERILAEIAQLGVRIAIDDFGTGFSSLSRLNRLPVSEIKVDKSFVTDMSATTTEPIVAATIELAGSLGQTVTAEGVEDLATWNRLQEMGCDSVQGYFLARPMPAAACTEWLVARQRPKLGLVMPA